MQTRTAMALVAAFTAGMALVPMSAKAVCQQTIYAERSFSDGGVTPSQIIGHVSTVDPFSYVATTTNPLIAGLIFAAVANRNSVFIVGSAANCPTTGNLRDMGAIIQIFQQP
jgi:hypothetical protein